jgi:hypothetical protein
VTGAKWRGLLVPAALVAVILLAACSGDDSGELQSGFENTGDVIEDEATSEIDAGDSGEVDDDPFDLQGEVPSDFPEEITLPEGGQLVFGLGDPATMTWTLIYTDLDEHTVAAYRDSLVGDGFDIQSTTTEPDGGLAGFIAAGHGYDLVVGGSPDGFLITVMKTPQRSVLDVP